MKSDRQRGTIAARICAVVLALIGIGYLLPGIYLFSLGGTVYYAVAGAAALVSAVYLWRAAKPGIWIYALLLAGTIAWALFESGLDGWALVPRLLGPALFGLLLIALPGIRRAVAARSDSSVAAPFIGTGALSVLALGLIGVGLIPDEQPAMAPVAPLASPAALVAADPLAGDWQGVGNDPGNLRHSPLTQITRDNVGELEQVWSFRVGVPDFSTIVGLQATPIKIGDAIYLCSGYNDIIKLDAETGQQVWRHEARNDMTGLFASNCRGVTYVPRTDADGDTDSEAACAERIVTGTTDGRLLAVDTMTGRACANFGTNGVVDLKRGLGDVLPGYFTVTSPPQLVAGKLVVNGSILDGQFVGEPSAAIRAYDAVTGEFVWAWDIGRPGEYGEPGPGESYVPGMPNSWPPMAADEALGLVYVPMGNSTPDYYGAHRSPEAEKFTSAIVALDVETGEPRWSFQTTRHDLWDYDLASPPTLADVRGPGGTTIPVILQGTKRGELFMLDRRTGEPVAEVEERRVPVGNVPGERYAPTQPFPVGMPSLAGPPPSEKRMWGVTPFDQMWCRIKFRQARFDGTMTPVGVDRPSIVWPGYLGGMEWGGVSVDPQRGVVIVNTNRVPNYNKLLTRAQADAMGVRPIARGEAGYVGGPVAQAGTPFAADIKPFLSPLGVPCTQPPYGMLAAIDLATQELIWERPFGTGRKAGPLTIPSNVPLEMGVPQIGGPITTASGITFIGASQDGYFRAIDTGSGRELWRADLPAGGQATPLTYWSDRSGRQFVVITAGGHGGILAQTGDYVVAYALPERSRD